jgi:hypothetical protein
VLCLRTVLFILRRCGDGGCDGCDSATN